MIISFGDQATEDLYYGRQTSRARKLLPPILAKAARRKIDMIKSAQRLQDLRVPPGNRLEQLKGDLEEMHSIRINSQWRVIFYWTESGAKEVQVIDYH